MKIFVKVMAVFFILFGIIYAKDAYTTKVVKAEVISVGYIVEHTSSGMRAVGNYVPANFYTIPLVVKYNDKEYRLTLTDQQCDDIPQAGDYIKLRMRNGVMHQYKGFPYVISVPSTLIGIMLLILTRRKSKC